MQCPSSATVRASFRIPRPCLVGGSYTVNHGCSRQLRLVTTAGLFGAGKQSEEQKHEQGQATAPIPSKSPGSFLNKLGPLPLVAVGAVVLWGLVRSGFIWKNVTTTKIPEATVKAVDLAESVSKSSKLDEVFSKMDLNGDGRIDLKEIALAMKAINPKASLSAARKSALDVFLLFDRDQNRYLDKDEFSRFLQRFCLLSDSSFDDFAEDLITKLSAPPSLDLTDKEVALELDHAVGTDQGATAIAERKLDGIFTVWDEDRDGEIKFKQLQSRLQNFDTPAAAEGRVKDMMSAMSPTEDVNRKGFGNFVYDFAKASGVPFADLADYLLVVPLSDFDPSQKGAAAERDRFRPLQSRQ